MGNAIGAAVARPTLTLNLHIDTEQKVYSVAEEGEIVSLNTTKFRNLNKISLDEAETLAAELLRERAEDFGISEYADEAEIVNSEVFNVVNGWYTTGRLFDVNMSMESSSHSATIILSLRTQPLTAAEEFPSILLKAIMFQAILLPGILIMVFSYVPEATITSFITITSIML